MSKLVSLVCKTCRHYDEKYDCKKVHIKYGTDGYGPWREDPVCINDPHYEPLKNLYEPAIEQDYAALKDQIAKLSNELYLKQDKIERLASRLAKEMEK